jgi:hypothetical protein
MIHSPQRMGYFHRILQTLAEIFQVYVAAAPRKPCFFADTNWLTVPFQGFKSRFDELIDILTVIPQYLTQIRVIALTSSGTLAASERETVRSEVVQIDLRLENDAECLANNTGDLCREATNFKIGPTRHTLQPWTGG